LDARNVEAPNLDARNVAWLAQQVEQLCAALVHEQGLRPQDTSEQDPAEAEDAAQLDDESTANLATSDAGAEPAASNGVIDNGVSPTPEHKAPPEKQPAPSTAGVASTAGQRGSAADFWDAVAAQCAGVNAQQSQQTVFDAVGEVAANRGKLTTNAGPAAPHATADVARQSVDIIAAFESLLGLDEEPAAPLAQPGAPTDARGKLGVLRQGAERALFTALTLQDASQFSAQGRRG
jgi:hypothetical protein